MASLLHAARRGVRAHRRRWTTLAVAVLVLAVVTGPAAADTESELASARERLTAIGQEIEAQRSELAQLQSEADAMATRLQEAESRLEEIQGELTDTQASLARARARFEVVQERFNVRARDVYMQGPANDLNFILGASSMGDLTDRLQYASVLGQADADLANQVQRLGDQLGMAVAAQKALLVRQTGAVGELDRQMDALNAKFAAQRAAVSAIADEQAEAERIVAGLREKYRDELAAVIPAATTSTGGGGGGSISGVFQTCPVGQPRAISDGFGAPRYGGGYHLHAGNDIMAPTGTPIYATFAGTAANQSNTLGGIAVVVTGSSGWTYNAHMSAVGKLGSVQTGDVIGYVGSTGDTSTPHNHFEWHPNTIPSNWPESPYGYSVIGDAVNPYPALAAVC